MEDQEDPIKMDQDTPESSAWQDATEGELPGPSDTAGHLPVLVVPLLEILTPKPGQVFLDCTLGRGGHASLIGPLLGPTGRYIGLDVDPENLEFSAKRLADTPGMCPFDVVQSNFANAPAAIAGLGVEKVDLLLADLGFASNQMDDPSRGFSFAENGPLDMRLDPDLPQTAADLVNNLPQEDLANLIFEYGEERLSRKIARKIVEERNHLPILTTETLARIVRHAYGVKANLRSKGNKGGKQIHPATRTFMALRIAVNGELSALDKLLADLPALMNPGGLAAVISFHSLEDRRVKQKFVALQQEEIATRLTRKPVIASDEEMRTNPRSRSAKMRVIQFVKP